MGGVAGEQDPPRAIRGRLPGHVGETGDPARAVHSEVGPVRADEQLAKVLECRLASVVDARLVQHDPVRSLRPVGDRRDRCHHPRGVRRSPAHSPCRPRRSRSWSTDRLRGSRCRLTCGSRCGRRRTRRGSPLAATCHRPVRRQRRCRPVRGRRPPRPEGLALGARRSSQPGCARSRAARAPARSCGGWGSR